MGASPATSCSELCSRELHSLLRMLFVALAVAATLGEGTAFASCGDYLFRNGRRVSTHSAQPGVLMAGELLAEASPAAYPVPVRRPCNGPNCSQAPFPDPVLPLTTRIVSEPAMLLESLASADHDRSEFSAPVSERGAKNLPFSLFRPPQSPAC